MSNAFKRKFDALAGPAFRRVGVADFGTFQHGTDDPIDMTELYIDDGIQAFGLESEVTQLVTSIRLFKRFDIPEPVFGDMITVGDELDQFKVDAIIDQDSSSYLIKVAPVSP